MPGLPVKKSLVGATKTDFTIEVLSSHHFEPGECKIHKLSDASFPGHSPLECIAILGLNFSNTTLNDRPRNKKTTMTQIEIVFQILDSSGLHTTFLDVFPRTCDLYQSSDAKNKFSLKLPSQTAFEFTSNPRDSISHLSITTVVQPKQLHITYTFTGGASIPGTLPIYIGFSQKFVGTDGQAMKGRRSVVLKANPSVTYTKRRRRFFILSSKEKTYHIYTVDSAVSLMIDPQALASSAPVHRVHDCEVSANKWRMDPGSNQSWLPWFPGSPNLEELLNAAHPPPAPRSTDDPPGRDQAQSSGINFGLSGNWNCFNQIYYR